MTAREAIIEMRDMISDRHGDYHQDDDALRYLNRTAQYVSTESESLRSGIYREVEEGQSSYGLPSNLLQIDFVGFRGRARAVMSRCLHCGGRVRKRLTRTLKPGVRFTIRYGGARCVSGWWEL